MSILKNVSALIGLSILSSHAMADQFHYSNIIAGDRAMGLGGAYAGISDDASGVIYNPAGLGFALSNDIQGSANAFYTRRIEYKNAIGTANYTEKSGGSFAPFFGGLQKLDSISPGLAFAFAIYSSDAELKDQDDLIKGLDFTQNSNGTETSSHLFRLHRTSNFRASTGHIAVALAKRFSSSFSLGASLDYTSIEELLQDYQDIVVGADSSATATSQATINKRQLLTGSGIVLGLGGQVAIGGNFSIGAQVKAGSFLSQEYQQNVEKSSIAANGNYGESSSDTDNDGSDDGYVSGNLFREVTETKNEDPLGGIPLEARVGFAWFMNTRMLWAADVAYYGATEGEISGYEREAVTNISTGVEYYVTPTVPVRVGVFTNNDARPDIDKTKTNQRDHIDYTGFSLFGSVVQPNSQISVGIIAQSGVGQAQKRAGDFDVQEVVASSTTFAFSATHSF